MAENGNLITGIVFEHEQSNKKIMTEMFLKIFM